MKPSPHLVFSPKLRLRREYFGALVWSTATREIIRLDREATAVALLHLYPCTPGSRSDWGSLRESLGLCSNTWKQIRRQLIRVGVIIPVTGIYARRKLSDDVVSVARFLQSSTPPKPITKPFWVHLQPFTRCNQRCIHCYCNGGPGADPFILSIARWRSIVKQLDEYGIMEVYVTGGESLLFKGFFDIAEEILDRRMGFGLSTNASVVTSRTISHLRRLAIDTIQVSLDGATAETHDVIRGTPGAFRRTIEGIARLATVCSPVINTVVNKKNIDELTAIVQLGLCYGCSQFKFYPQRRVGRSLAMEQLILGDVEVEKYLIPECGRLSREYAVSIETANHDQECGAGRSGFAINQNGDIFPCIFGVENKNLKCGNILSDEIDHVWFQSEIFARFRLRSGNGAVCHRCESTGNIRKP